MSLKSRVDLLYMYQAALKSLDGHRVMQKTCSICKNGLLQVTSPNITSPSSGATTKSKSYDLNEYRKIYVIGAGKSVLGLTTGFLQVISDHNNQSESQKIHVNSGILSVPIGIRVSDVQKSLLEQFNVDLYHGAKNNIPDQASVDTTKRLVKLLTGINVSNDKSLIVSFISGGGSALLSQPKDRLTLGSKQQMIHDLVKHGATINELNSVRRCLSNVKGGKLLSYLGSNHQMVSFIASDIINDPLELIASGPTVIPSSQNPVADACAVLNKYGVNISLELNDILMSGESSQTAVCPVDNYIVMNNMIAVREVESVAKSLNYHVVNLGSDLSGEASSVAKSLSSKVSSFKNDQMKVCFVAAGETTVDLEVKEPREYLPHYKRSDEYKHSHQTTADDHDVNFERSTKTGVGGRCQEMALQFYIDTHWKSFINTSFMAVGTDGQDGPTPVAGVVTSSGGIKDDPHEVVLYKAHDALRRHDSYNFWKEHFPKSMVTTNGPTGVNVMDLYLFIKEPKQTKYTRNDVTTEKFKL